LENRLCGKCGFDPGTGVLESPAEPIAANEPTDEATDGEEADQPETSEKHEHRGKRSGKRRKNRHFMLKLIGGWTLVLALIIVVARKMWHVDTRDTAPVPTTKIEEPAASDEDLALLNENVRKCMEVFNGFLSAGTPEERNQFVLNPVTTASRMARFYSLNPLTNIKPQTVQLADNAIINLPGAKSIETQWKCDDGRSIDALFREENGEWRLDWDHFARYSDYPWSLFLAGSGDPEGEFRLLARERLAEERKDQETISIVLYAPRFGHPLDTGFQSPEFLVSRASHEGRLLEAAFKLVREGKQVLGSTLLKNNPDDMIRVRLKVRRTEAELERKFQITKVIACHWYTIDDPGVEPSASTEEPAEEK
jgi:hypothetical protein